MLPRNEGDWSIWKNRNSKCEDGCPDCCTTLFCRFNEMLFENKALGATIVLALLVTIAIVVRIILPKIFSKPS
ncbi:MAG: hypothetical protein EP344_02835 [Bacteroidetes bacterium]|nr:MAG: hypothetical protein EP344_02835 [Bacteroidota bacterium]